MTAGSGNTNHPDPPAECWCCGTENATSNLVHLDNHSEVAVCLWCAEYLGRRADEQRDHLRPSAAGRARDVLRAGRRTVMDHGWQGLPVLGPGLRWLGRHLP